MRAIWVNITDSQVLSNTPGYLHYVLLTSDGSNTAHIRLYDGSSAVEGKITDLKCGSTWSEGFLINGHLNFHKGLYVEAVQAVESVLVIYSTYKE